MKLQLEYSSMVNGVFSIKKLNLLFVFQVNCPGCFVHGIPVMNEIFHEHAQNIGILGLSTCFEDFELNTQKNTARLVENGHLVGETKKMFALEGKRELPYEINFPIAYDRLKSPEEVLDEEFILKICEQHPGYAYWSSFDQLELRKKVKDYYSNLPGIAMTFACNQLQGTPTFIVFDDQWEIIGHHFGAIEAHALSRYLGSIYEQVR